MRRKLLKLGLAASLLSSTTAAHMHGSVSGHMWGGNLTGNLLITGLLILIILGIIYLTQEIIQNSQGEKEE